jgi:hypothetical protein
MRATFNFLYSFLVYMESEPKANSVISKGGGTFQDLPPLKPDITTEKQSLLLFRETGHGGHGQRALAALVLVCFFVAEVYGIYVLAVISPTTQICFVEIIVIAQVFTAVVVPAVIYFVIHPVHRKSWDLWCVRCVMLLFWSLFIASAAVISDKAADACASGMNFSVVAFMVVDAVIGAWATFGWLTADWT